MVKRSRIGRRGFLVASGVVLAQAAMVGRPARALAARPGSETALAALSTPTPLSGAIPRPNAGSKIGVSPMYITSARGENLRNPHFRPQGLPSATPLATPRAVSGTSLNEEKAP